MSSINIVETLREDIVTGRISAGDELRQTALADRFGVSRIPIRDAISALAKEKLVVVSSGQGAKVVKLTVKEHMEIFDLRELLECHALATSIQNMTDEQMSAIRHTHRRAALEAGRTSWSEADRDFHMALYAPSRLDRTLAIIFELRQVCRVQLANYDRLAERTIDWLEQHEEIIFYAEERDVESAIRVLGAHIRESKVALFTQLDAQ